MDIEIMQELITSNDYVDLEVGAKTEVILFLEFVVWDDLNGASCDMEYFDHLIDQETFARCDSPIEGWSITNLNGSDYEIGYQPVMTKDWEHKTRHTFDRDIKSQADNLKGPQSGSRTNPKLNKRTSEIDWDNVLKMVALSIMALRTSVLAVPQAVT